MRIIRSIGVVPSRRLPSPVALGLLVGLSLGLSPGAARAEPPIRSPEDAFCRSEARAQVFSAPDPLNLGLREIGRRIWAGCMERTERGKTSKPSRRRRQR